MKKKISMAIWFNAQLEVKKLEETPLFVSGPFYPAAYCAYKKVYKLSLSKNGNKIPCTSKSLLRI